MVAIAEEVLKKLSGYREVDGGGFPPVAVFGVNGTGKTYFLASASMVPELCPVCLITIAKSDHTLADKSDIDLSNLFVLDPRSHKKEKNISNMWDAIHQTIRSVVTLSGPFPFKAVAVDGLSIMQYWAEQRAQAVSPFHQGQSVLLELTQQGDYRLARERILDDLLNLKDVCEANGAAFLLSGQERMLQIVPEGDPPVDEKGNEIKSYKATIALMPSLIQDVLGMAAIVGKMRVSGSKFILETRRSQYLDAKDQTGYLDARMDMPTMAKLVKKLTEGGQKARENKEKLGQSERLNKP